MKNIVLFTSLVLGSSLLAPNVSTTHYVKSNKRFSSAAGPIGSVSIIIDKSDYDCIVLDIGLPDGSGLKVINEMQQKENQTAIVIVSAKNSLDDRLIGLNGADIDTERTYRITRRSNLHPFLFVRP